MVSVSDPLRSHAKGAFCAGADLKERAKMTPDEVKCGFSPQFEGMPGVNKKPKKFKAVWHGFWRILKLSGRVNQESLKLSAAFSNTVC